MVCCDETAGYRTAAVERMGGMGGTGDRSGLAHERRPPELFRIEALDLEAPNEQRCVGLVRVEQSRFLEREHLLDELGHQAVLVHVDERVQGRAAIVEGRSGRRGKTGIRRVEVGRQFGRDGKVSEVDA